MIIFDVGANDGRSFEPSLDTIYAFEPNPKMINFLLARQSKNYIINKCAVSNYNGKSTFYIDDLHDSGCSSLKEFSDNLEDTWPGRNDFAVTSKIEVDVIRLDTFIEQNNITQIDILHIDAQGSDYEVIESLGKYFSIVKLIECEACNKNPLYKNIKDKNAIIELCENNGFKLVGSSSNDKFQNEENLRFINVNSSSNT